MAKNSPGTLNSRTVRISLRTYLFLKEMSEHSGLSMAETLDKLITHQMIEAKPIIARAQMPMPVLAYQAKPALSVNGNRHIGFGIKPKGGKIQ